MALPITKEQKQAFKQASKAFDELVGKYGIKISRWAFTRKLNWEAEKVKLAKEKKVLEERLSEIQEELT